MEACNAQSPVVLGLIVLKMLKVMPERLLSKQLIEAINRLAGLRGKGLVSDAQESIGVFTKPSLPKAVKTKADRPVTEKALHSRIYVKSWVTAKHGRGHKRVLLALAFKTVQNPRDASYTANNACLWKQLSQAGKAGTPRSVGIEYNCGFWPIGIIGLDS